MVYQELAMGEVELRSMVEVREFQGPPVLCSLMVFQGSVCVRLILRLFGNMDWATGTRISILLLRMHEGDKASPLD